jgi:hypothetical protein
VHPRTAGKSDGIAAAGRQSARPSFGAKFGLWSGQQARIPFRNSEKDADNDNNSNGL